MAREIMSVGVDIGSTKVITCVGKFEDGAVDIIGVGKSANQGMRKGAIIDIEETVSAISASLDEAERAAGVPLSSAVVGLDGAHIESTDSKGVIAVARADGEITDEDIARVTEAARAIPNKPNREILHVLPRTFVIDGQEGVKDPVGMNGIRLEVEATVISTSTNALKNVQRCIEQSGLNLADIVFAPLAEEKILLSKRQIEIGVILIDVGATSTSYTVYEEGDLINCGVVPIGSSHISNDIAIGIRTSIDVAEKLKLKHGFALPEKVQEKEEIDLKSLDKKEEGVASVRYISEIIEARLKEILLLIQERLQVIGRDGTLPAGVILTGGGCKLEGIVELTKETLRLPAQIGTPIIEIGGLIDKLDDPVYSTSIGLMLWGRDGSQNGMNGRNSAVVDAYGKAKKFFKQFLP